MSGNEGAAEATRWQAYQEGWTPEFAAKTDVDFVVQKQVLPVHSILFYESTILQGCFADTTNSGKPELQSCFRDFKLEDVVAFLSQVYPTADLKRTLLRQHCAVIVELAKKLECKSILNAVQNYLIDNPNVIKEKIEKLDLQECRDCFAMVGKMKSKEIDSILLDFLAFCFQDMLARFTSEEMESIFSNLPGETVLHLAIGRKDKLLTPLLVEISDSRNQQDYFDTNRSTSMIYSAGNKAEGCKWTCQSCRRSFFIRISPASSR